MEEIEVQSIGCESAETAFASCNSSTAGRVAWQDLAYQENFPAATVDCLAHQFLGATVRVHFRGID
jgi:hypothetical protein